MLSREFYESNREYKKAVESDKAFYARRQTRQIRADARKVDPNSGFRLNTQKVAAAANSGVMQAIRNAEAARQAEAARVTFIPKRDRRGQCVRFPRIQFEELQCIAHRTGAACQAAGAVGALAQAQP